MRTDENRNELLHFVLQSFHYMFDFQFLIVQNRSYEDLRLILLSILIVLHVFSIDFSNEYFHDEPKSSINTIFISISFVTLINSSSFSLNDVK